MNVTSRRTKLVTAAVTLLCAACSSGYDVAPIAGADSGSGVAGAPFRVKMVKQVEVWGREGDSYRKLNSVTMSVADPDVLYALRFQGMPLADSTIGLAYNADGTFSKVGTSTDSKAAAAVEAVGTQASSVAKAIADAEAARETRRSAVLDRTLAYETAMSDVEKAQVVLSGTALGSVDHAQKAVDLKLARIKANDKARRLGLPPPFPAAHP